MPIARGRPRGRAIVVVIARFRKANSRQATGYRLRASGRRRTENRERKESQLSLSSVLLPPSSTLLRSPPSVLLLLPLIPQLSTLNHCPTLVSQPPVIRGPAAYTRRDERFRA